MPEREEVDRHIENLGHENQDVVENSMNELADMEEDSFSAVKDALDHENEDVRINAAKTIGEMADRMDFSNEDWESIIKKGMAEEDNSEVQEEVKKVVTKKGGEDAVEPLMKVREEEDEVEPTGMAEKE